MVSGHSIEVNAPNIVERFDLISSIISENFRAAWTVRPIGVDPRPASLSWAQAEGVRFSHAEMSPLHLINATSSSSRSGLYYIYTADRPSRVRLHSGTMLQLQASEFLIFDADMPLEWTVQCDYTTRSLLVDKALFHDFVPHDSPLIGRRLTFEFGIEQLLAQIMDTAWAVTNAGHFERAGPKLVRAFLGMLTMQPQRGDVVDSLMSPSGLELRRLQVKAFIDRNFSSPGLCIASIARHLRLSPRYIQMAFASDDITPSEYLRKRRLAAAVRLLESTAQRRNTITEIALSCGFSSSAYFSTEFRRAYGISPRAFRESSRIPSGA